MSPLQLGASSTRPHAARFSEQRGRHESSHLMTSTLHIDAQTCLKDIRFAAARDGVVNEDAVDLDFLDIVQTRAVPLSFIAGPSQDVHTDREEVVAWFGEQLGNLDAGDYEDSQLGVLTRARNEVNSDPKTLNITEILFYATKTRDSAEDDSFTLKALPLCSQVASYLPSPPLSPCEDRGDVQANFLTSIEELQEVFNSNERKRKQVSSVFDEATERRRKARRHGGAGVAAAAATHEPNVNILVGQKRPKRVQEPHKAQNQIEVGRPNDNVRGHSRTNSFSGGAVEQNRRLLSRSPSISSDIRPLSRKGPVDSLSKRSSLSRVSSMNETASIEDRNKDAISRLVMAGLRLYGFQPRKKSSHSRRLSDVTAQNPKIGGEGVALEDAGRDEEYKLIYHQAYKGTVFAFRRVIAVETLYSDPAALQDTVDKHLAMYCNDPLIPI